jgi:ABC-type nitrate/sulfonate/bicarbonate transport system permease component
MALMPAEATFDPAPACNVSVRRWLSRRPGTARLGLIVFLVIIWEVAARFFLDRDFISPPSLVVMSLGNLLGTAGLPAALGLTFYEIAIGFLFSVLFGATIGLAVGLSRFAHRSFMPIILLLYGLPQITILPIFVLLFGIGAASKIAFGVSHGMFPIMIAVAAGARKIDPVLLTSARSMGASRRQLLRYVVLPSIVPSFFTGMRLGMTGVLLGVLLAELYVSTAGIGYFTSIFTQNMDPTKLIGLVSMLAMVAIVLNEIIRQVERQYGRWRD